MVNVLAENWIRLFNKHHSFCLYKITGFNLIKIYSARQITSVEINFITPGCKFLIYECSDFFSERVKNGEFVERIVNPFYRYVKSDFSTRIKRVRIILAKWKYFRDLAAGFLNANRIAIYRRCPSLLNPGIVIHPYRPERVINWYSFYVITLLSLS